MMRIFSISIGTLVIFGQLLAQAVFVPLDHQVYPLLVKGETLGLFHSYRLRVVPLTRTEALQLLKELRAKHEALSAADQDLLAQMIGELTDPAIGEEAAPESEPHLFRYDEGDSQIFLDTRGIQEFRLHRGRVGLEDETISETAGIGYLRARFGDHVCIGASARSSLVRGEKNPQSRFDPSLGTPQVAVGQSLFTDQATGYVGIRYGVLGAYAGRMQMGWGSSLQEQLGLSARNEPMDMVRFSLDFSRVRFSYFHANLQGQGNGRYLAGHRLDILFGRNIQAGMYETVVYAGRGAQLGYLNPFVPYHIMEHQLGDLDNNTAGVDVAVVLVPGVRASAELFVDDFSFNQSLGGFWGNKFAYNLGLHWAQPFGIKPLELLAQYTHVDPYVYTHYDSLNIYAHYDASIGSRLGPNADRYLVSLAYQPLRDVRAELFYSGTRQGQGTIFGPVRPADNYSKHFLRGTVEQRSMIGLNLRYQFYRNIFLGFEGWLTKRRNANLLPGRRASEQYLRLYLDLNYY
jgi:hypothetical protein